jgi:hypothetical protein
VKRVDTLDSRKKNLNINVGISGIRLGNLAESIWDSLENVVQQVAPTRKSICCVRLSRLDNSIWLTLDVGNITTVN